MYLKSLELHGFKSFPDKTVLRFNSGTTVIVGPNGSGKSNITDAMRWVLGELSSRSLRGNRMEDVVFAGSDDKKPMSFAEVSVTFDNSGNNRSVASSYDEITVTRRYYRSGDSEYYINRKKVRLKDIYELFMNTGVGREGYSIIGQGKIAEIISKKSEDRRAVFEESAGISRFRYKKNESEKRLAETEQNMARVEDIEHELAQRIGPLERDSEKAKKYLELWGEKKKTDVSLWIYEADSLKKQIAKTEGDTALSGHELDMAEDTLTGLNQKIGRLDEQRRESQEYDVRNRDEIRKKSEELNSSESSLLLSENNIGNLEQRIISEKERRAETEAQLKELTAKLESQKEKIASLDALIADCGRETEECRRESEVKEEAAALLGERLDELFEEKTVLENELSDLRIRLSVIETSAEGDSRRREDISTDIGGYREKIRELDDKADKAEKQAETYRKNAEEIGSEVEKIKASLGELVPKEEELTAAEREKLSEIGGLDSRINVLSGMLEHFDGYNNSVRFIMSEVKAGRLSGIRGPLSYLIRVDGKYVLAIETALGGALQNIVTENENDAKKAIYRLKETSSGRATFHPISTVGPQTRYGDMMKAEKAEGFIGWADSLVGCDDDYKDIVSSHLARVAVFGNLDEATDAARTCGWKVKCVTLDGQLILPGGSLFGGQPKKDSGMLSRTSQITSLEKEKKSREQELSSLRRSLAKVREEISGIEGRIEQEKDRISILEVLMNEELKNYSDADGERRALVALVESMETDLENLNENTEKSSEETAGITAGIAEHEKQISDIEELRNEISLEKGDMENGITELASRIQDIQVRAAGISGEKTTAAALCDETEESINNRNEALVRIDTSVAEMENTISGLKAKTEENRKRSRELREEIAALEKTEEKIRSDSDSLEKELSGLRTEEEALRSKKEILLVAHEKNKGKLESLRNEDVKLTGRMWEDYEMTYAAALSFAEENGCHVIVDGEKTSFTAKQTELRNRIKGLGHVNVDAISEFTEVKNRYEHIKTQLDDLRKSKGELEKILEDIEREMKDIFLDAFEKINRNFGEVFRELFGGGYAEVRLADPDNPLESGVEINAAPPGKTIKNLNLLSGGEQAFIAIALLFALIKVNPSPFCIFDEIEAALDEVNVARVGKYIKNYSKEMQIIMISHRRGTMDIADTLYGVTMQQSGISKVFTLESGDDREDLLK